MALARMFCMTACNAHGSGPVNCCHLGSDMSLHRPSHKYTKKELPCYIIKPLKDKEKSTGWSADQFVVSRHDDSFAFCAKDIRHPFLEVVIASQ